MADLFKYVQNQPSTLYGSGAVQGATTIILSNFVQIDGTLLTMTDFGNKGFATIEPGNGTQEEQISFSGIVQNANGTATLTGVKNVLMVDPYTETSGISITHPGGVALVISNTSGFYNRLAAKNDDETITGTYTFTNPNYPRMDTATPAPTDDAQLATKKYVDDTATSGAPNATTTVKGIVQLATAAQTASGTVTGSTGASLVPQNGTFNATSSAAVLVPVTNASGKLSAGFGGSALSLATLDSGSLVVENPANATAIPTANKIPIADANGKLDGWVTAQAKFGGTGADGALSVPSGTTTINAASSAVVIKNYTTANISLGAILTLSNPNAIGTVLIIKTTGDCTIDGTIELSSFGASAGSKSQGNTDDVAHYGSNGGNGSGSTGGAIGAGGVIYGNRFFYTTGSFNSLYSKMICVSTGASGGNGGSGARSGGGSGGGAGGGGGASFDVAGSNGGVGGSTSNGGDGIIGGVGSGAGGGGGGSHSGDPGANTGGAGGNGGGAIIIECAGTLVFTGTINVNGADGGTGTGATSGAGGGGSAGMALLLANTLSTNSGTVNAKGGAGAAGTNGNGGNNGGAAGAQGSSSTNHYRITTNTEFA